MQTPRMNAAAEPRILAKTGALVVAEDGPLVLVIDPGTGPRAVLAFVLGVFALTLGGFGAATLVFAATGVSAPPATLGAGSWLSGWWPPVPR